LVATGAVGARESEAGFFEVFLSAGILFALTFELEDGISNALVYYYVSLPV
jgi:hypothetical protein